MSDLAASNFTITVDPGADVEKTVGGRVGDKWVFPTLTFGNGVLTYPSGGIPMPSPDNFFINFARPYKWVKFLQPAGTPYRYDYDPTPAAAYPYGRLRITNTTTGAEFSGAVAATTLYAKILG